MSFLGSPVPQYFIQATIHSIIIAIIVETLLRSWQVQQPFPQIKFRFLVLALPALYLPFLFLFFPARTDVSFAQALFNSREWLSTSLWEGIALWPLPLAVMALTTGFFCYGEAAPLVRQLLRRRLPFPVCEEGAFPKLDLVLSILTVRGSLPMPAVLISPETVPEIFTLGRHTLVLSARAIELLDEEELEAVIAHELAHFTLRVTLVSRFGLILRFLTFYNPLTLLIFRHIVTDSEKICDDMAVAVTGKPLALASGLLKIFRNMKEEPLSVPEDDHRVPFPVRVSALEDRACQALVKERIKRILNPYEIAGVPYQNLRLLFSALVLAVLLFFVV